MDPATARQHVYDQIPAINCQGLCHESCGPVIPATTGERTHIAATRGVDIRPDWNHLADYCPALTMLGRCSVYEDRPTICRLWGVVESMPCPWGCQPEHYLTDEQGHALLAQMNNLDRRP